MVRAKSVQIMEELAGYRDLVCAVLWETLYVYDDFVSKGSLDFARQRGLLAIPQDFCWNTWKDGTEERFLILCWTGRRMNLRSSCKLFKPC